MASRMRRPMKQEELDNQVFEELLTRFLILKNDPDIMQWYQDWQQLPFPDDPAEYLGAVSLERDDNDHVNFFDAHIENVELFDAVETVSRRLDGYRNLRWNLYMDELVGKLRSTLQRITFGLGYNEIVQTMPSVSWEVNNALSRQFLEDAIQTGSTLSMGQADIYANRGYYDINKFFRDLSSQGRAKIDWPVFRDTQYGHLHGEDNLQLISQSASRPHPFQLLQWLMALSPPTESNIRVYRWGNGPERNVFAALNVGNVIRMVGYTSTSILPWLTIDFAEPQEVREALKDMIDPNLVWDGVSQLLSTNTGGVAFDIPVNAATDKPYGMSIGLPAGTRCLYIPSPDQAEILLPHGSVLQLDRVITLNTNRGRDIPFFVMTLVNDGIEIVE